MLLWMHVVVAISKASCSAGSRFEYFDGQRYEGFCSLQVKGQGNSADNSTEKLQ